MSKRSVRTINASPSSDWSGIASALAHRSKTALLAIDACARYKAAHPRANEDCVTQAAHQEACLPPRRAAPAAFLHDPWHHRHGRLCLAEGRELAGGAARSLDPGCRISAAISKRKIPIPKACSATPMPCRRSWSRRCAGASRRTIPACRRRTALSPISANSARAASTSCSAACRATAARKRSCSTATRWRQTSEYFKFGGSRHSPDHRLQAWSADTKGSEYFSDPRARLGERQRIFDDLVEETDGARGVEQGLQELLLRQARRQPSPDAGLAPSPRHASRPTTCSSMRNRIPAGSRICTRVDQRTFLRDRRRRPRNLRAAADRSRQSRCAAAPGRGARGRRAIFDRRPRRRAVHPHQCR